MKLILDDNELKEVLHYCFCNGGLSELASSDIHHKVEHQDYNKAKKAWIEAQPNLHVQPCYEDVLLQILVNGDTITFIDYNDSRAGKKLPLTLQSAKDNLEACPDASKYIPGMLDSLDAGDSDAFDCWNVLQYMLFKELIYG